MSAKVERRVGARGVTWWLVIHADRKRKRKSYGKDRQAAEKAARKLNSKLRDGSFGLGAATTGPTLAAFTKVYLANRIAHLSTRQQRDRRAKLKKGGQILGVLGDRRLGALTSDVLLEWVETHLRVNAEGERRSKQTITHYINALGSVLKYAKARRMIHGDPIGELRTHLSEEGRTKRGRAAQASHANPIVPEDLIRLLGAAKADPHSWTWPIVVCLLDSGIRLGEVRALTWGQVVWGDAGGTGRHLLIDRNKPSGLQETETTKSGYSRKVQLSTRLRAALLERWVSMGQPGPESLVYPGLDGDNFRRREWARICGKTGAGIGHRQMKDLRDSFGSILVSAGIPIAFIAAQLGHQSTQLTEKHYARWIPDGDEYQAPEPLGPGQVPADIIARLTDASKRPNTSQIAAG
jgi:integrase